VREIERLVYEPIDTLSEAYDEEHPPGERSRGDGGLGEV